MQESWGAVDEHLARALLPADAVLEQVLAENRAAGLPAIDVSPLQGAFLTLLTRVSGARRVLEIGTLGGYSTIHLARGLPGGGRVVTLEFEPHHAEVARRNLHRAGLAEVVEVRVGAALDTLPVLEREGAGPFDLVFIDADKRGYPQYLEWAVRLSRPGTVLVGDNVVRRGGLVDPAADGDPDVRGVRTFLDAVGAHPRLSATALQTVGAKGWDGFALAVVD
nr:O-methyltransferase [Kineococcus indalonis]